MKNTPEWKQYEWLISKIFHDSYYSIKTTILHDANIKGQYSERSRQIDILVEDKNFKTIIECKYYKNPLDVKGIESFLGMYNDVKADYGIVVALNGFSKSANKRVSEYNDKIKLEHIDLENAFNSFNYQSYGKVSDICNNCNNDFINGTMVPGLLLWKGGYSLEVGGILWIFNLSKCLKCGNKTLYCDSCGVVKDIGKNEFCCEYSKRFLDLLENDTL